MHSFHHSVIPTLVLFPSAVRDVVRGEALVAPCQARDNPSPVIQWYRGDVLLSSEVQTLANVSIMMQENGLTIESRLTMPQLSSEDVGVYSCVAVNSLGNDSRSFQVNIVGELIRSHGMTHLIVLGTISYQ